MTHVPIPPPPQSPGMPPPPHGMTPPGVPSSLALPTPRTIPLSWPGMALLLAGFFIFLFGTVIAAITGVVHPVVPPILGFMLLVVGGIMLTYDDPTRTSAARYVRLRQEGDLIRLTCPSCGGTLGEKTTTRGVILCEYCRTRVLVP